eukprot:5632159-Prymnesium_polylepis.1
MLSSENRLRAGLSSHGSSEYCATAVRERDAARVARAFGSSAGRASAATLASCSRTRAVRIT